MTGSSQFLDQRIGIHFLGRICQMMLKQHFRKMLRKICGTSRRYMDGSKDIKEPWANGIVRATNVAEKQFQQTGLRNWVDAQKQRKTSLMTRMANSEDDRWAKRILQWEPHGYRRVGKPDKKWTD